jgi:hypothetical protein
VFKAKAVHMAPFMSVLLLFQVANHAAVEGDHDHKTNKLLSNKTGSETTSYFIMSIEYLKVATTRQ